MASSRLIVAGETYTADDINNLRADVLDTTAGHDHDGTDGKKVAFSDLDVTTGTAGSAAPSGGGVSYDDIDSHVAASQEIHGLGSSAYVLGSGAAGYIVQGGLKTGSGNKTVTFPVPFTDAGSPVDPVSVVVTPTATAGDNLYSDTIGATITAVSSTSFDVDLDYGSVANTGFYWMAIGKRT